MAMASLKNTHLPVKWMKVVLAVVKHLEEPILVAIYRDNGVLVGAAANELSSLTAAQIPFQTGPPPA